MFLSMIQKCHFILIRTARLLRTAEWLIWLLLFQMMSASVSIVFIFLIVNSFWSDVQALPPFSLHDAYNKLLPNIGEFPRLGAKRQFDPWGGKKRPYPSEEMTKRQFSPWGGKRTHDLEAINGTRVHSRNANRGLPTLRVWVNAISWLGIRNDSLRAREVARRRNKIPGLTNSHLILRQEKFILILWEDLLKKIF